MSYSLWWFSGILRGLEPDCSWLLVQCSTHLHPLSGHLQEEQKGALTQLLKSGGHGERESNVHDQPLWVKPSEGTKGTVAVLLPPCKTHSLKIWSQSTAYTGDPMKNMLTNLWETKRHKQHSALDKAGPSYCWESSQPEHLKLVTWDWFHLLVSGDMSMLWSFPKHASPKFHQLRCPSFLSYSTVIFTTYYSVLRI